MVTSTTLLHARSILVFCLILLVTSGAFAQKKKKHKKKERDFMEETEVNARGYMDFEEYDKALELWLKLDSISPEDPKYNYFIGVCYMHSLHQERALDYLKFAKSKGYDTYDDYIIELDFHEHFTSLDIDFNLGRAYHLHHEFDKAIEHYKIFEDKIPPKSNIHDEEINIMDRFIEQCHHAKELVNEPVEGVTIKNLGPVINSEYPDYVPVISADETMMIFTTRRPTTTGGRRDPNSEDYYMEDIVVSFKDSTDNWTEPVGLSDNINSDEHESCIFLSADGQDIFVYKNDHHGAGSIFQSHLNGQEWSTPEKLPDGINSKHWEGSASMTANEKWIFFSSDRPGGAGSRDIYWAKRLPDNRWGEPRNMGPSINTQFAEDAPFIHPDAHTLYFSSRGHFGMGGYDIFKSEYDEETDSWSKAENIGYPINTADDDIFFVFSADGKRAYFSSHHEDSYGDKDIYILTRPDEKVSLIVLKGVITTKNGGEPVAATIKVTDNETGEVQGVYSSNAYNGRYLIVLPTGKNLGLSIDDEGFLPYSENVNLPDKGEFYEETKDIQLETLEPGSRAILRNVFFDYNKATLRKESFKELDRYLDILNQYPTLYIEIAGHTDSIGSQRYNEKLSQQRTESVVEYFVSKGIEKKRLYGLGYGERFPIAPNTKNGKDNPQGRQQNRRTEIIIHEELKEGIPWTKDMAFYYAQRYKEQREKALEKNK